MYLVFIVVNILNWTKKIILLTQRKANLLQYCTNKVCTHEELMEFIKRRPCLIYLSACCFVKLFFINISLSQPSK